MSKNIILICLLVLLFITGCSQKELITTKYYNDYSKDDILLATKRAVLSTQEKEKYMIDSYRDRVEIVKIDVVSYITGSKIIVKEYTIKVKEDDFGTKADMSIQGYFEPDKTMRYQVDKNEHNFIWERIDFFLNEKDMLYLDAYKYTQNTPLGDSFNTSIGGLYSDKLINSSKSLKNNIEFSNGPILDNVDTIKEEELLEDYELLVEEIDYDSF